MEEKRFSLKNIEDDFSFRDRVVQNQRIAVDYFLTVYSRDMLEYISKNVCKETPTMILNNDTKQYEEVYYPAIVGAYYTFIAAKFPNIGEINAGIPQWDKLKSFSAKDNCRLHTYVGKITFRHFLKKNKEPSALSESEMLFQKLCDVICDEEDYGVDDLYVAAKQDLVDAIHELEGQGNKGRKASLVLSLSYLEGYDTMEIAGIMEDYFSAPLENLGKVDIQVRISQWRLRAAHYLADYIYKEGEKGKFRNLIESLKIIGKK